MESSCSKEHWNGPAKRLRRPAEQLLPRSSNSRRQRTAATADSGRNGDPARGYPRPRRSVFAAGQPASSQVSRMTLQVTVSSPPLTGRSGTQRARACSGEHVIRSSMCGRPAPFRSVRDLGLVPPGCPVGSGAFQGCSSVWLPAWLPAGTPCWALPRF